MPTSAPGNSRPERKPARHRRPGSVGARGFTLLELLVVIAIVALASAVTALALRDPDATRLEREGQRLATLLEAGRARSRALGLPIQWRPAPRDPAGATADGPRVDFHFDGLPSGSDLPQRWLAQDADTPLQVELPRGQTGVLLGPEPVIGAQRIALRVGNQRLVLATDGLGPFAVVAE